MSETIHCPNCDFEIEMSTALVTQMRERVQSEFDADFRQRECLLAQKNHGLQERERALDASIRSLDEELSRRLALQRDELLQEAQTKAREALDQEVQDLLRQLSESRKKLGEAQKAELQLRRERQELEDQKTELELTVTRRLDAERKLIRDDAKQQVDEEHRLREADSNKLIADLRTQIDDLKRVVEQGSPQARGEVMELVLEDFLRNAFPQDTIEQVPVSYHGGDVVQRVFDASGLDCGTILWESKRTKSWSAGWLPKLRDDQRAAKAQVAVLATAAMPDGLITFGCIDRIWVTNHQCLLGLGAALRHGMIEAARARRTLEGRQSKADLLCSYLASTEFRQRIEGIVEAFVTLKSDLDSEKRSFQRMWAKREKQLDRAALNTAGLYGDFGGILGSTLPQIANLELAVIEADAEPPFIEPPEFAVENSTF